MREMADEILKKIAHELAESLRQNVSEVRSVRDKCAGQSTADGKTHSAQVQIPAGSTGSCCAVGAGSGGDVECRMGVVGLNTASFILP